MGIWKTIGKVAEKAVPIVATAWAAKQGSNESKKANDFQNRALDQSILEYNQRAPLRRQGMQALGQVESPMNLGNLGFNGSNPFAAARGPAPSTASYGDWGRMTSNPEAIDNALAGVSPQDLQWAQNASGGALIGKSGGKQRFLGADGSTQFTNKDRERAISILGQYQTGLGYDVGANDFLNKRGVQPIRPIASAPTGQPWGPINRKPTLEG